MKILLLGASFVAFLAWAGDGRRPISLRPIPKRAMPIIKIPDALKSPSLQMLTYKNTGQIKFNKSKTISGTPQIPPSKKSKRTVVPLSDSVGGGSVEMDGAKTNRFMKSQFGTRQSLIQSEGRIIPKVKSKKSKVKKLR
ncbi:MAG: hypothetical protein HY400_00420 [Elusimicrobia bacterium]|nr:hypothetical protein [Elusimicrobiota bacterium]